MTKNYLSKFLSGLLKLGEVPSPLIISYIKQHDQCVHTIKTLSCRKYKKSKLVRIKDEGWLFYSGYTTNLRSNF